MENETDVLFCNQIKEILSSARSKAYSAANFAMVESYWLIGKSIVEQQDGNHTAEYDSQLLNELSTRMIADFGKGFDETNLKTMRQFYLTFLNRDALCRELSWSHYRLLMRVENESARQFYIDECVKSNWSIRQLERQINTHSYERLLASMTTGLD